MKKTTLVAMDRAYYLGYSAGKLNNPATSISNPYRTQKLNRVWKIGFDTGRQEREKESKQGL